MRSIEEIKHELSVVRRQLGDALRENERLRKEVEDLRSTPKWPAAPAPKEKKNLDTVKSHA